MITVIVILIFFRVLFSILGFVVFIGTIYDIIIRISKKENGVPPSGSKINISMSGSTTGLVSSPVIAGKATVEKPFQLPGKLCN